MMFNSKKLAGECRRNNTQPVATFDFYGTMTIPEYDEKAKLFRNGLNPNYKVLAEMVGLANEGWLIFVLTDERHTQEVENIIRGFLKEHKVPVQGITYTAKNPKCGFAKSLKSIVHYDDDKQELRSLMLHSIVGILV
jgi:hypothetical protein